ncbi:TPA: hypothetical protein ACURMJ_001959 [Escherichia coli]|uniref:hypothetical protein n=1 Tax=Citrobacter freundii TaxID=546 RepID=UPI0015836AAC|nr:hypothetical protein [Citrobacter freundii]EFE0689017.1 hypothetical protein [Escherichia coli]EGE0449264.1 hypothetical protein [Escherichia coli]QLS15809.1 hypothetical protein HV325_16085 [Citrobacter freundii]
MENQQLLYGVKYGDKVHFDFAVRLPVVNDTIEALRATDEACGTTEGAAANMYYRVAVMACAITALGDVPKEEITAELLLNELNDDDFDLIDAQIEAIKKKRMDLNKSSPGTEPSSSPSGDTVSVNNKSEA